MTVDTAFKIFKPSEKTNNLGFQLVQHKPACTVTEAD